jgi:hypothetical protein
MKYCLGNILRGYVRGNFKKNDDNTAWEYLSHMFLLHFPVEKESTGRYVVMYREEEHYGYKQTMRIRHGLTSINDLDDKKVKRKCKEFTSLVMG